jgi:hypothetical protein
MTVRFADDHPPIPRTFPHVEAAFLARLTLPAERGILEDREGNPLLRRVSRHIDLELITTRIEIPKIKQREIMYSLLMFKFRDGALRKSLLNTKEKDIHIQGSEYWGINAAGIGQNWTGKLLMRIRQELCT